MGFKIPSSVQKCAQQALEWHKQGVKGTTKVGLNTARILAKGGEIGIEKVRHIAKYFPRHEVDKKAADWSSKTKITPGKKSWYAWGGDPGWKWAAAIVKKEEVNAAVKGPKSYKWVRFSGAKSYTLKHRNGKTVHKLKPGDKFGYRTSRSGKYSRIIVPELGPTYVFTLSHQKLALLVRRTDPLRGIIPKMKKDNRTVVAASFCDLVALAAGQIVQKKDYQYNLAGKSLTVIFPEGVTRNYGGIVADHVRIALKSQEASIISNIVKSMTGKSEADLANLLDVTPRDLKSAARGINKKLTAVSVPARIVMAKRGQSLIYKFRYNVQPGAVVANLETAGSVSVVASQLKKFKFNVETDGENLTATHERSPLVKVTLGPVTREGEDGKEETVYVMEMDCPLYDNAAKEFFIKAKAEGKNPSAAFNAWYPVALKAFAEVKKSWAKEINGQIGKRYYWLTGFFAKRYNKSKK